MLLSDVWRRGKVTGYSVNNCYAEITNKAGSGFEIRSRPCYQSTQAIEV